MSRLDDFLAHHVEGYLFYDLRTMSRDDADGKGVGYPILMSCCAGIEFLGALRSNVRFEAHGRGKDYFAEFWRNCLYPPPSLHTALDEPVYQLIRHGIAHSFITKGNIGVLRHDPAVHLTRDANGQFVVDAVQLAIDLQNAYTAFVRPVLTDPTRSVEKASMEQRLTEMESDFGDQATKKGVPPASAGAQPGAQITSSLTPSVVARGATGPLPPGP